MPSPSKRSLALLALLLALQGLPGAWAAADEPAPLQPEKVEAAMQQLQSDPLLGGTERRRTRRFKPDGAPDRRPDAPRRDGFDDFMQWLADGSRWLIWLGFFAAAALLAVLLPRWWRYFGGANGALTALPDAPSHVRALDIRPASLPEDIGAAAAALWQRGETTAALSLLYRGALSRLVHVHRVPIRAASTEGECLALARPRLAPAPAAYVAQLVELWQRTIYAGQRPAGPEVLALCEAFAGQLPAPPAAAQESAR